MWLDCEPMQSQINIYEFVMERLRAKKFPQTKVAMETGVPYSTLTKIAQGVVTDPSVKTVQKLYDYFVEVDRKAA